MIDDVSNKGYAEVSAPATVATSGAGSGYLNLLAGPGGTANVNAPTNGQPLGTIAFVVDSTVVTGNGTYKALIQTCSDNATFSNATYSNGSTIITTAISNVANTAGLQVLFVDSTLLSQYNRAYDVNGTNTSVIRNVTAFFVPKNP